MRRFVCDNFTIAGFWRGWHASFNGWLRASSLTARAAPASAVAFGFVAFWHDATPRLALWGAANVGFLALERALGLSGARRRRAGRGRGAGAPGRRSGEQQNLAALRRAAYDLEHSALETLRAVAVVLYEKRLASGRAPADFRLRDDHACVAMTLTRRKNGRKCLRALGLQRIGGVWRETNRADRAPRLGGEVVAVGAAAEARPEDEDAAEARDMAAQLAVRKKAPGPLKGFDAPSEANGERCCVYFDAAKKRWCLGPAPGSTVVFAYSLGDRFVGAAAWHAFSADKGDAGGGFELESSWSVACVDVCDAAWPRLGIVEQRYPRRRQDRVAGCDDVAAVWVGATHKTYVPRAALAPLPHGEALAFLVESGGGGARARRRQARGAPGDAEEVRGRRGPGDGRRRGGLRRGGEAEEGASGSATVMPGGDGDATATTTTTRQGRRRRREARRGPGARGRGAEGEDGVDEAARDGGTTATAPSPEEWTYKTDQERRVEREDGVLCDEGPWTSRAGPRWPRRCSASAAAAPSATSSTATRSAGGKAGWRSRVAPELLGVQFDGANFTVVHLPDEGVTDPHAVPQARQGGGACHFLPPAAPGSGRARGGGGVDASRAATLRARRWNRVVIAVEAQWEKGRKVKVYVNGAPSFEGYWNRGARARQGQRAPGQKQKRGKAKKDRLRGLATGSRREDWRREAPGGPGARPSALDQAQARAAWFSSVEDVPWYRSATSSRGLSDAELALSGFSLFCSDDDALCLPQAVAVRRVALHRGALSREAVGAILRDARIFSYLDKADDAAEARRSAPSSEVYKDKTGKKPDPDEEKKRRGVALGALYDWLLPWLAGAPSPGPPGARRSCSLKMQLLAFAEHDLSFLESIEDADVKLLDNHGAGVAHSAAKLATRPDRSGSMGPDELEAVRSAVRRLDDKVRSLPVRPRDAGPEPCSSTRATGRGGRWRPTTGSTGSCGAAPSTSSLARPCRRRYAPSTSSPARSASTLDEALDAMRWADRVCTLTSVQSDRVKRSGFLKHALLTHVFTRVLPVPRPRGALADRARPCLWADEDILYGQQLDGLILLQRLVEHFAAAAFSINSAAGGSRTVVPAVAAAVADALARRAALDEPSYLSLTLSGAAGRSLGFGISRARSRSTPLRRRRVLKSLACASSSAARFPSNGRGPYCAHAVATEDDVLHVKQLPSFGDALGQHDSELLLSYLTVPYIRLPLVLRFFSTEDRVHALRTAACQGILDAVLFEPGRYLEAGLGDRAPRSAPCGDDETLLATPYGHLLNELQRSPKTTCDAVVALLKHALDLDAGTVRATTVPIIQYLARTCARRRLPRLRPRHDADADPLNPLRDFAARGAPARGECADGGDKAFVGGARLIANLEAHNLVVFRTATSAADMTEDVASTVACAMTYLQTRHSWNRVALDVPETEVFGAYQDLRRPLLERLTSTTGKERADVCEAILRVTAGSGQRLVAGADDVAPRKWAAVAEPKHLRPGYVSARFTLSPTPGAPGDEPIEYVDRRDDRGRKGDAHRVMLDLQAGS
ncbi:hypothetical protein JL720_7211 [Aureococcus anophagefferens]|nr:hypothetical protein JL720_7211 [Aureococcus anophagefferens]